jgi:pimeloyl-ACP methyl ester carboxylesterase
MNETRRLFLLSALAGLAGSASLAFAPALAGAALPVRSATDVLRAVASAQPALNYHAAGPADGRPIVLVRNHGHSIDSFVEVATLLAAQGFQVLLPHLRDAPPAALGQDLIGFIDALHMPEAVFVGTGQGSAAAAATVQARRSRVIGLVLAGADKAPTSVPTIALAGGATPQQIADAAATLVRQGTWRT